MQTSTTHRYFLISHLMSNELNCFVNYFLFWHPIAMKELPKHEPKILDFLYFFDVIKMCDISLF